MMIASRNGFAVRRWKNPYVTDGLVAMWDGEWNAGNGKHDANATVWKDLVGTCDVTLHGTQIFPDHVYFPKGVGYGDIPFMDTFGCIEVVLSKTTTNNSAEGAIVQMGPSRYSGYGINAPGDRVMDTNDSAASPFVYIPNRVLFSVTLNKDGAITSAIAKNGMFMSDGTANAGSRYAGAANQINAIGEWVSRASNLWFRCMRVYSRNLTASEIAANYAVDKARFGLP